MSQTRVAIYEPPAEGFPFVVVSIEDREVAVATAETRKQARDLAIAKRRPDPDKTKNA